MTTRRLLVLIGAMLGVLPIAFASAAFLTPATSERAWRGFWEAKNPKDAERAAEAVLKTGLTFEQAVARLKQGRPYSADVPRGVVKLSRRSRDVEFPYTVEVPESYDPTRRYQVRVHLHGGVARPEPLQRGNGIGPLAGGEQIYVMPIGWAAATWWTERQLENLRAIVDIVKRTYNVDENRVVVAGVSDGGTGAYYVAMRDTTPYASFLPLIGALAVLRNPSTGAEGELFPNNLLNKPLFIVNAGRDRLYPTGSVEPYINHLRKGGAELTYLPQPDGGHNIEWWPGVKDAFESFVRDHPRNPFPTRLTWETDLAEGTTRAHWIVIDALSNPRPTEPLPDLNDFPTRPTPSFGVRSNGMRVTSVMEGSGAASFGLLPGDLVLKVDEVPLPSAVELVDLLSTRESGKPLSLVVRRNGKQIDLRGTYQATMMSQSVQMFRRVSPSGRVDLERDANSVRATTRGVAEFTLLLSPDVFDFTRPVIVVCDGKKVFDGRVAKSLATLMKWAARDNDRSALIGAELHVMLDAPR
jgi:hypothetical protein